MEAQKDRLVRAISKDGFVNAVAVYTRGLTERARQIHHTSPVATAALGRALAACSMMGNALKDNGASVTMQIKGDGPLGTILTVSDSEGNVRGYVQNPAVDLALREDGKLDVGTAVGHSGTLTVIKDLNMREPYVGTVDLLGGEIAEDVAAYYVESEQVPSACGLGVLIDRDRSVLSAGGYLIQLLPGAGEDVITKVEGGIYAAPSVTNLLKENPDPAVLLKTVLSDFDMEILSVDPIEYRCYCSRERTERALLSLGSKELEKIVDEQGQAVPQGEVGELCVKGPGVMRCYYHDPEATAAVLHGEWLHTGDMAKQDADGFYFLVDRKKDVIISGGENLYPVQIEDFLSAYPKIHDVAVIGLPDKRLGEIAAAIIQVKDGMTCTESEINQFCTDLPRYKRPRKIIFADVPRNPTGKIEKPKLREKYCGVRLVEAQNQA